MVLAFFSLFGCAKKEKQPQRLADWLDMEFPDQLIVLENVIDLNPALLFSGDKKSIVADKQDQEVQILVAWNKKTAGLGVEKEAIARQIASSREDVRKARAVYTSLHEVGLDRFSVGVVESAVYILVYEDLSPESRKALLDTIVAMSNQEEVRTMHSIWIEMMEPAVYQEEFKTIVPYGYWKRGDTYHERNIVMSLYIDHRLPWDSAIKMKEWKINNNSQRAESYTQMAYATASDWVKENVASTYYTDDNHYVVYDVTDEHPMSVQYAFPYFSDKQDAENEDWESRVIAYVTGTYQVPEKKFTQIQSIQEP